MCLLLSWFSQETKREDSSTSSGKFLGNEKSAPKVFLHNSGTEKVPQRTCATKILPNFRVNFFGAICLKTLVYWGSRIVQKILWCCSCVFWLCDSFLALKSSFCDPGTSWPKSRDMPAISCLKQQSKGALHKVFGRDIPTSGSLMPQDYPARKLSL